MNWSPWVPIGVLMVMLLGSALFSKFSLIEACLVKTRERFVGIGQVLTMLLFFAGNAICSISIMPSWLRVVSQVNPLSYEVAALRLLILTNGVSAYGLATDLAVLLAITTVIVILAGRLYPRVIM